MLEITLNAREVGLITVALRLACYDWGDPSEREALELNSRITEAWVAQNPDEYEAPWLDPIISK